MAVTMVFDLETIPDIATGRQLLGLSDEGDKEVADAMMARRTRDTQGASTFLPHHLHQIITLSVVVSTPEWVKVWSLGDLDSKEPEIILRFFEGVQKYTPNLVSWNGSGFDLPVLHYRSLYHGVAAPRYWESGEHDNGFKWNNYLGRYHQRHLDVMDVLAGYQNRAFAPLDEVALMLGFPGKMGMHGSEVWPTYLQGGLQRIREYCEMDVLNTFLVHLRFQYIRGQIDKTQLEFEEGRLKTYLSSTHKAHLMSFLEAWESKSLYG